MTIDLEAGPGGWLMGRGARLTSPSLHLPESCDRDTLRRVGSNTIPPWSRTGRGKFEWSGVVKIGWSVLAADVTKGTKVKRLFLVEF